jgi:hypothetical protein
MNAEILKTAGILVGGCSFFVYFFYNDAVLKTESGQRSISKLEGISQHDYRNEIRSRSPVHYWLSIPAREFYFWQERREDRKKNKTNDDVYKRDYTGRKIGEDPLIKGRGNDHLGF